MLFRSLRVMAERNFALGVAYYKTEIIQVAVFAFVFLGDVVNAVTGIAIAFGTLGVLLLSPADKARPLRTMLTGWTSRTALIGLASGAGAGSGRRVTTCTPHSQAKANGRP